MRTFYSLCAGVMALALTLVGCGGGGSGNNPPQGNGPQIAVHFPPPASLTDIPLPGILKVRGTVSDDDAVAGLTVNGAPAELDTATGAWSFDYEVVTGTQAITVEATDASGDRHAVELSLTHVPTTDAGDFGGGDDFGNPDGLSIDPEAGDFVYADSTAMGSIDPANGDRHVFYRSRDGGFDGDFEDVERAADGTLYGMSVFGDVGLGRIDRNASTGTPVSIRGDGNGDDEAFEAPRSLAIDDIGKRAFAVTSSGPSRLWRIDLESGARELVSTETGDNIATDNDIALDFDPHDARLLVGSCSLDAIYPDSGERETLVLDSDEFCAMEIDVSPATPEAAVLMLHLTIGLVDLALNTYVEVPGNGERAFGPMIASVGGFDVDWNRRVGYLVSDGDTAYGDRLTAVDLVTGHRVVLSMQH